MTRPTSRPQLEMTSNVSRDVLGTAGAYGTVAKVASEYATNSVDAKVGNQRVSLAITFGRGYAKGRLIINDNASGMDGADLERFFTMHSENDARRRGRAVRGRFGTGKVAAFGIGTSLQIETVKNGRRFVVRLERAEIEAANRAGRNPRPQLLVWDEPTQEPSGTTIIVDGISKASDRDKIVTELRRVLGRHLDAHDVKVNGRSVPFLEPQSQREWRFEADQDSAAVGVPASTSCTLHAATANSVDDSVRGVVVTADEFPVAQVVVHGDYAGRLFGRCEIPALAADNNVPGPYSDARDLTLNETNPLARAVAQWLRSCLTRAAAELAAEDRERRRQAQSAALQQAANRMEAVLNRHYRGLLAHGSGAGGTSQSGAGPGSDSTSHADKNGSLVQPQPAGTAGSANDRTAQPAEAPVHDPLRPPPLPTASGQSARPRPRDPLGSGRGDAVSELESRRRRRTQRGGFRIGYREADPDAPRASYLQSELLIELNLSHPELAAARRDSGPDGDGTLFRMLAFEAAAQEYAFVIAYERLEDDESLDAADALQLIRQTVEELTRDVADVVADLAAPPPTLAAVQ